MLIPATRPARILSGATLVNTLGTGLYLPASALYFTKVVGLGVNEVSLGLGVAGALGLLATLPVGRLADMRGPRGVYALLLLTEALAMAGFVLSRSFTSFVILASIFTVADRGAAAARGALIAGVGGDQGARVALRAYLRAVTNVGITAGAGLAGIALSVGSDFAYTALIAGNAVTFLLGSLLVLILRSDYTKAQEPVSPLAALRDRRYSVTVVLLSVLALHIDVLTFAMPLWLVQSTQAPAWTPAAVVAINTVLVVALQVRLSRGTDRPSVAVTAGTFSGLLLLLACVLLGATGSGVMSPGWLLLALAGFAVAFTLGEILHSASSFGVSYAAAPEGAHGQYQGLLALGAAAARAVSPPLLTWLCLGQGLAGWTALGVLLAGAGLLLPVAWRTGTRTRLVTA